MTELAWASRLFDGEGSICVCRGGGNYRRLSASITQYYSPEVLERFLAATGLGSVKGPHKTKKGKLQWDWCAAGFETVTELIGLLWPALSGPKREQAAAATTRALRHHVLYGRVRSRR